MSSEELAMRNAEVEALRAELTKRDANTKEYREMRLVTEAFKDDDEKPMMDLIPADVTLELGRVLAHAPTDIAALLADNKRLREANDALVNTMQAVLHAMRRRHDHEAMTLLSRSLKRCGAVNP